MSVDRRISTIAPLLATVLLWTARAAGADAPDTPVMHLAASQPTPRPAPPREPERLSRVSIGAGFGIATGTLLSLGGLGGIGSLSTTAPVGTALVELALSRQFRLVLGASGSYRSGRSVSFAEVQPIDDDPSTAVERTPSSSKSWAYGARTGLRWVINPGGVVEVSPLLTVGYDRSGSRDRRSDSDARGDGHSKSSAFDVQLGLVLERRLIDQLYLRFSSSLLQFVDASSSTYTQPSGAGFVVRDDDTTSVGLALSPSIELRLTF